MKVSVFWMSMLSLLAAVSCVEDESVKELRVIGVGQQIEEPVEVPLRDVAKDVEFIQLETSDSLLLPTIYNLKLVGDNLLIDGRLFDRRGKFLRSLYRVGEGPDEVHKGANVTQVRDNKLYVLDFQGVIRVFSMEGELLETVKTPALTYFDFRPLDGGKYVGFKSNFGGKEKTCLEFFDSEGLQATVPYTKEYDAKATLFAPGEGKFFETGSGLLLKKILCDTIFQVEEKGHKLAPVYRIDFGKWAADESIRYTFPSVEELQMNLFTKVPFVSFLGQGERYLAFTVTFTDMVKQRMMLSTNLYDRQAGTTRSLMLKFSEDDLLTLGEDGNPGPDYMKGGTSDYFFPQVMSEDGRSLISWRQQANDLNPVVVIATLE